jgi:UDP-4-amino-4,6-dideoxy-N-acetyl-beta-L-altrosamine N-acetyltransferase
MNIDSLRLTDYLDLPKNKYLKILAWRNRKDVRKWMHSREIIGEEEHIEFLEKLKKDKSKRYFLVTQNEKDLGVVYFTSIDGNSCYFGMFANPAMRGGLGNILMKAVLHYAFSILRVNILKLEVYKDNERAIKLYKKFGFVCKHEKSKELIEMELNGENWKI